MNIQSNVVIYFIKLYVMNLYVFYGFNKIVNINKIKYINQCIIHIISFMLVAVCTYVKFYINSFLAVIVLYFLYGSILSVITNNKIGYSLIITIISYAISIVAQGLSIFIEFIPYKIFQIKNNYINLFIILLTQFILLYRFFKIKRFKNGFDFLYKSLNNELIDTIIINVSIIVLIVYCLIGTIYDEITWSLIISFGILAFTMFIMIQKTLTMYYKQKLLEDTLKEYKQTIDEKENEIKSIKDEKFNISKITHKFYNRQKALELLVESNIENKEIKNKKVNQKILNMIKSLEEEYAEEISNLKKLQQLEKTEIAEIDTIFKYMQNECNKNNIQFKLKIIGNIYPLINNIIPKNKLETLIGDHIRDAINAVKSSKSENKEILTILGIKNEKYELSIYDTGVEFEIETLLKLGKEATTTHSEEGGSGIGFITTFETMKQTKASLIISEQKPKEGKHYTKSVTIRFDGKNKYKIQSYRAEKIKEHIDYNNDIIIENLTNI